MVAAITLSPTSGNVGSTTVATGTGYALTSAMTFTFGGVAITPVGGAVTTNGTGGFTASFIIPANTAQSTQGAKTLVGTDASAGTASATFTITPQLVIAATSGNVGDTNTITLTGYAASSAITVKFGATTVTPAATSTNTFGALVTTYTIPSGVVDSTNGAHTVAVNDAVPNTASATFTINAKIVLTPNHGDRNVTISVTATGYSPTSALTSTMGGVSITLAVSTTTVNGDLTTTFAIPTSITDGSITVSITDALTHNATTTYFLEIAGIVLNTTFSRLNGRNLFIKSTIPSREREAIVDITFSATDEYATGGVTVDFSTIQQFKTVYLCEIVHKSYGLAITFVPDATNRAGFGKLKFFASTGLELADASTAIQGVTLRCRIRGN